MNRNSYECVRACVCVWMPHPSLIVAMLMLMPYSSILAAKKTIKRAAHKSSQKARPKVKLRPLDLPIDRSIDPMIILSFVASVATQHLIAHRPANRWLPFAIHDDNSINCENVLETNSYSYSYCSSNQQQSVDKRSDRVCDRVTFH